MSGENIFAVRHIENSGDKEKFSSGPTTKLSAIKNTIGIYYYSQFTPNKKDCSNKEDKLV